MAVPRALDHPVDLVIVVAAWLAIGAAVGIMEGRRGRWRRGWVVTSIFGPFALGLAAASARLQEPTPSIVASGVPSGGDVDVLVGIDGSAGSLSALSLAEWFLRGRVHRLTLAVVLDYDTCSSHEDSLLYPEPWPEEVEAREHLAEAAAAVAGIGQAIPRCVVLAGAPAVTLANYAREQGEDLIVIGSRGRGMTKAVFGSCAKKLARESSIPVLVVPFGATAPSGEDSSAGAERATAST